jgi:hypothetical protein
MWPFETIGSVGLPLNLLSVDGRGTGRVNIRDVVEEGGFCGGCENI